jgi:hypothetical protein
MEAWIPYGVTAADCLSCYVLQLVHAPPITIAHWYAVLQGQCQSMCHDEIGLPDGVRYYE